MSSRARHRTKITLAALAVVLSAGLVGVQPAVSAQATSSTPGVYIATGHDLDYHCAGEQTPSCDMLSIFLEKAAGGATPHVLAITGSGTSRLAGALTSLAVNFDSIDAVANPGDYAAANFANYNVVIFESIYGSDAPGEFATTVASRSADVIAYYNSGGGVIQQSNGGGGEGNAWDTDYFLTVGFYAASVNQDGPRSVTAAGDAWGVTDVMVNCCATHNAFLAPPTSLTVLERDVNNLPVSLALINVAMPADGIGGNVLQFDMSLDLAPGQAAANAVLTVSGSWLKANSDWAATLYSDTAIADPQILADSISVGGGSPTNVYGAFLSQPTLPSNIAPGSYRIVLTGVAADESVLTRTGYLVIDSSGNLVSFSFTDITLPVFTSAAEAAGTVGSAFSFTVTTTPTGLGASTYAITAGELPAGLALDPATGVISGTPTVTGVSTFTISATNEVGTTTQPFVLTIAAADATHLPVVSG